MNVGSINIDIKDWQINARGTVALGGLYFDHNEATLTEKSEPTLNLVAEYVSTNDGAEYVVLGHIDNQGGFDYNQNLSEGRAHHRHVELVLAHRSSG